MQSLEAVLLAELSDNECWTTLEALARQAGREDLATGCGRALAHERDHLRHVRGWLRAGQGVSPTGPPEGRDGVIAGAARLRVASTRRSWHPDR